MFVCLYVFVLSKTTCSDDEISYTLNGVLRSEFLATLTNNLGDVTTTHIFCVDVDRSTTSLTVIFMCM